MERWLFFSCRGVSSNDFSSLEALCKKIIKEKQTFERLEVKKETLLEMFKVNWALTTSILSANPWSSAPLEKLSVFKTWSAGVLWKVWFDSHSSYIFRNKHEGPWWRLISHFQYNKFKCRILNEKVNTPTTTVYRWEYWMLLNVAAVLLCLC